MVKGVSKSVIEIQETGNRYFSKVILYISPEFSSAGEYKLSKEAEKLINDIEATQKFMPIRQTVRRQKIKTAIFIIATAGLLAGISLLAALIL